MSNQPLITIIVPIYNSQKYLEQCIESIINQTYKNLEIILINDGSEDESLNICNKYKKIDNRIIVINQENSGVSVARNSGLKKASGEWISFVDSDDWIEKKFCEILIKNATENNVDVVFSGYNKVYKDEISKINVSNGVKKYSSEEFLIKVLNVQTSYGFIHMKLIKKSVINNIFFESELKVAEDALFNIKLCENVKNFLLVPQALYNYRINSNSI